MKNEIASSNISIKRIIIKTILILFIINFGWILLSNLPIGDLSLYNLLFDGRYRLPFGENPKRSYNLSLYNLDAMFASHEINKKQSDVKDLHVVLIGDSSIWGFLQEPDNTLSGLLNKRFMKDDKNIIFHNLGYPSISILKDLMVIDRASEYNPDLVLWFITLEALPKEKQLEIPIIKNNPWIVNSMIEKYKLSEIIKIDKKIINNTLWNQRRNISDLLNLQLFGILWNATGIDQEYPETYNPAQRDFAEPIEQYYIVNPDDKLEDFLALEIIKNGIEINKGIDFILINEPILISEGVNSSVQYNYYYPRWAYDQYRLIMKEFTQKNNFRYYDLWNLIPEGEFTNSAIHLSEDAENKLADEITLVIEDYISQKENNDKE
jgi:hypothetical protein